MTTLGTPNPSAWTATDLRGWRSRLRWTQAQAATSLCFHLEAYKKLECGTRIIGARVRRLCILTEREHVRSLVTVAGEPGARQVFATPDRVSARLEALRTEGHIVGHDGKRRPTYVSLCAGIEAATAALERIGADAVPLAFSEIDGAANAVLRHRFPDVPRVGDVTAFDWSCLRGHVDLVTFGAPCQSFSIMGHRLGVSDPRGNIMLHCLRAIGVTQPNWVLFENVPGLLNSNGGDDFEACLTTFSELGYSVAWRVLDARHFGLAQRRRRLWLIAQRGRCPDGPAEILALRDCKGGVPAAGGTLWQTPTRRSEGCNEELASEAEVDWSDFVSWMMPTDSAPPKPASGAENPLDAVYAVDLDECTMSATETQTLRKGGSAPSLILQSADGVQVRRCTPLECLRLQGFDDNWLDGVKFGGKLLSDSARYQLIGNSWPVPVAAWILERLLGNMGSLPDGTRLSATPTCAHPDQGMHQSSTKLRTTKPRTSPDRPRH